MYEGFDLGDFIMFRGGFGKEHKEGLWVCDPEQG